MSLFVGLDINRVGDRAGLLIIRRTTPIPGFTGDPKDPSVADVVSTYEYLIAESASGPRIAEGTVTHRYGDGALVLLALVMQDAKLAPSAAKEAA